MTAAEHMAELAALTGNDIQGSTGNFSRVHIYYQRGDRQTVTVPHPPRRATESMARAIFIESVHKTAVEWIVLEPVASGLLASDETVVAWPTRLSPIAVKVDQIAAWFVTPVDTSDLYNTATPTGDRR